MSINTLTKTIRSLAEKLGFIPESNTNLLVRKFTNHNNYSLSVDFVNGKISYGAKIVVNDETISNFAHSENFVVLECVVRLLEKGYAPEHLELEPRWSLGRAAKGGKADILVKTRDGEPLIIIECKTFGYEYDKERERLFSTGGQLLSYLQQEQATRFLCLYASHLTDDAIEYVNTIVRIEDSPEVLELLKTEPDTLSFTNAKNVKDYYDVWKNGYNNFSTPNGIFDEDIHAYEPAQVPIKRKDLKPFTAEEGRKFFNQFAEILRHNNISDQSNAFNRILSLILCKIVDEQKKPEELTDFQIKDFKEPAEQIQDRLQKLYANGMKKFLNEDIIYYSDEELERVIDNFPRQAAKREIREMFRRQKFYSNNEFAFKEVHNEKLFLENAKVLNEILRLLQYKQFRYARKDSNEYKEQKRYLGEFFELLLDAGYKQTSGQFFTPLPIAKFIVSSLPVRETIKAKLDAKEKQFLPLTIDYACGSGHFLIEAIDEIQTYLDTLKPEYTDEINQNLEHWQKTDWTDEFIYGIEKDYRLARTSKLACFMNGDGEANIIFGDGLADYRQTDKKFSDGFDFLAANPPYSVHGFKPHIKDSIKGNDFTLLPFLTETASEIEVLFIERAAQLLKENACAGIILPSSILSGKSIYARAREILLRAFEIRAIVEFGSNTFMATGTNTVNLFLKRRDDTIAENAVYVAQDFIIYNKARKNDFADNEKIFDAYAQTLGVLLADYKTLTAKDENDAIKQTEWFADYKRWFENLTELKNLQKSNDFKKKSKAEREAQLKQEFYKRILAKERDKFEFFYLAYGQKTLIVRAPKDGKEEKAFLGYDYSNRRGAEGINLYTDASGRHQTALYDNADLDNPEKLNYLVRQTVLTENYDYKLENFAASLPIPATLPENSAFVETIDCLDFTKVEFEKNISLTTSKKNDLEKVHSKWNFVRLNDVAEIYSGGTPDTKQKSYYDGGIHWATLVDTKQKYLYSTQKTISVEGLKNSSATLLPVNTVIFSSRATIGDVTIAKVEVSTNQGYKNFVCNPKLIDYEFLYYILKQEAQNIASLATGLTYAEINKTQISNYKIPLPPLDVQKKIVDEIEVVEREEETDRETIEKAKDGINDLINNLKGERLPLRNLVEINPSKKEIENLAADTLVSFVEMASVSDKGGIMNKVDKSLSQVKTGYTYFRDGDVLFAKITPCMENGKGALASGLTNQIGFGSTEFYVLRANDSILPQLLYQITQDKDFRAEAEKNMTGTSGHRRVTKTFLENYIVNVPKKDEQKKIVAAIKKHEAIISEADARLAKTAERKAAVLREYL